MGYSAHRTDMTAFTGGTFEASGVVHVPGTDGVLFVDDDHTDEIFFMRLGEDRKQAGPITAVKLSANIIDLEGITTDGAYFYVVGSQSKPQGGDLTGLARFKFDAQNQRVVDTQSIAGLKSFLANNVDELRGMQTRRHTTMAVSTWKASRGIRTARGFCWAYVHPWLRARLSSSRSSCAIHRAHSLSTTWKSKVERRSGCH